MYTLTKANALPGIMKPVTETSDSEALAYVRDALSALATLVAAQKQSDYADVALSVAYHLSKLGRDLLAHAGRSESPQATLRAQAELALSQGELDLALTLILKALKFDANDRLSLKILADVQLTQGQFAEAVDTYRLIVADDATNAANSNLAIAYLGLNDHDNARNSFHRVFVHIRGIAEDALKYFDPQRFPYDGAPAFASAHKAMDRFEQVQYLTDRGKLHKSFQALAGLYVQLSQKLVEDATRDPYEVLAPSLLKPFGSYFDKTLFYENTDDFQGEVLSNANNYERIEQEYLERRALYFDDFLTTKALKAIQTFCRESMIYYRFSAAGFVGSYMDEGFDGAAIYDLVDDLKARLPHLIGHLPLNNMWVYRYGSQGPGVRPHNGDGSVTLNFWLTEDEANIGPPGSGGMIIYGKVHPTEWDWLTYNARKDDPEIQRNIAEYIADAPTLSIPYKCNRAVLFHSTLFHATNPFTFEPNGYENRRMNVTMLFGKRSQESVTLR